MIGFFGGTGTIPPDSVNLAPLVAFIFLFYIFTRTFFFPIVPIANFTVPSLGVYPVLFPNI